MVRIEWKDIDALTTSVIEVQAGIEKLWLACMYLEMPGFLFLAASPPPKDIVCSSSVLSGRESANSRSRSNEMLLDLLGPPILLRLRLACEISDRCAFHLVRVCLAVSKLE